MKQEKTPCSIGRREFLGATTAGLTILNSSLVRGTQANSAVSMGLLGCGGRGTEVATGFLRNTNTRMTALADLFEDRISRATDHFNKISTEKGHGTLDSSRLFSGVNAARQIFQSREVDFVLIATPPYFHPEHLELAVKARKHVYCEKPVAVDVPGAKMVMKLGDQANGKLSLDVGFQIRNAPPFVELTRRIQDGALGKISSAQAYYYTSTITRPDWPNATPDEARLRNWMYDRALSGDIVVEQNIHVIDICNWVLDAIPVSASGSGGRRVRNDSGDCYDHFVATLNYPSGIHVAFSSTQHNRGWWDVCERFFGSAGVSEAHYSQPVAIYGDQPWDYFKELGQQGGEGEFSATGSFGGALDQADPEKQKAFVESITSGRFHNQARQGAESALAAMLVREAAYSGEVVTWAKLLKSDKKYEAKLNLKEIAKG